MIPRGRPVINEADIAERAGVPLATWRRRDAPAFREHVPSLFPGSRFLIYDLEQALACLQGTPVPALPAQEDPDDQLNDKEAADILGIDPGTVRGYARRGYLSPGETLYGARVWRRREIEHRRDHPPGQGKGGGRRAGEPQGPRKAHPYADDPRLQTAGDALATSPDTPITHIATNLAQEHGGSPRTWERLLNQARQTRCQAPE